MLTALNSFSQYSGVDIVSYRGQCGENSKKALHKLTKDHMNSVGIEDAKAK